MAGWVDHYRVLQVHHEAEKDVIEAAYRKLASKYHPDVNKDPAAQEKMQQINNARDILTDPLKRADFDMQWRAQQPAGGAGPGGSSAGATGRAGSSPPAPPRPVVVPGSLRFDGAVPGRVYRASFTLRNDGGPCGNIKLGVAFADEGWLTVTGAVSVNDYSELPLQVTVVAVPDGSRSVYNGTVYASLNNIESRVAVSVHARSPASSAPAGPSWSAAPPPAASAGPIQLREVLSFGMAAAGTLLLVPGLLFNMLLLIAALMSMGMAGPERSAQCMSVAACSALSLLVVAPGAALLRRGLMEGAAAQKWWRLSMSDIREDGRWLLPLGLGSVGGILAWRRVKDTDRARALKMLTWGIAVSVLQPVALVLFIVTRPA